MTQAADTKPAQNNFTLLRLTLALLVVFGHFKILAAPGLASGIFGFADFAVDAFFVVSGFLIAGSYDKQPHLIGYFIRRLFRIYPLYVLVVVFQAVAMVMLLPGGFESHMPGFLRYLGFNLIFANFQAYDIDGVLAGLYKPGINPSLWTLKIEVAFYIILPLLWYCTRRWGFAFLAAVYVASTLFAAIALGYGAETAAKQLPGQLRFFIAGIGLYHYRHRLILSTRAAIVASLVLFWLCTLRHHSFMLPIYPMCAGLLVFIVALRLPALSLSFDISYGVYLVHGPLIQLSLLLGIYRDTPGFFFALLGCTIALAAIADVLIERPAIRMGHRLAPSKRKQPA